MNADQIYFIDNRDLIISTDKNWDGFAIENLSEVRSEKVIAQSIWTFISNQKVKTLYQGLFSAVRNSGKNLSLQFRCDSDKVIRHMQMTIQPMKEQIIKICTTPLKEIPRQRILSSPILYIGIKHAMPMCSSCNRVYVPNKNMWLEIEEGLKHKLIPDPLSVRFDLCLKCNNYLEKLIDDTLHR